MGRVPGMDLLMATLLGKGVEAPVDSHDPLKGLDLEKEFELIQQKKSRLSSAQRDRVVNIVAHSAQRKK